MATRYEHALRRLFSINRFQRVKLGVENVDRIHRRLGSPFDSFPIVHVAGTNGKGSVCWKVATALEAAGARTGLFVSPHVSSFRERMRVNRALIPEADVVRLFDLVVATAQAEGQEASFFEITTLIAGLHFAEAGVDAAVVEVGLGGRLDATNIVNPLVCAITPIGLDHQSVLGSTVAAIAAEKAGIIKPSVPVAVAPDMHPDALHVIEATARSHNAPLLRATVPADSAHDALQSFNTANSATATAVLRALADTAPTSGAPAGARARASTAASAAAVALSAHPDRVLRSLPPCRLERLRPVATTDDADDAAPRAPRRPLPTVVLDAAHNPMGCRALFESLPAVLSRGDGDAEATPPPRLHARLVVGASGTKPPDAMAAAVLEGIAAAAAAPRGTRIELSSVHVVQAAHPRAMAASDVAAAFRAVLPQSVPVSPASDAAPGGMSAGVTRGVRAALGLREGEAAVLPADGADIAVGEGQSCEDGEVVVVFGSLFLMPEARAAVGIVEPRDPQGAVIATSTR